MMCSSVYPSRFSLSLLLSTYVCVSTTTLVLGRTSCVYTTCASLPLDSTQLSTAPSMFQHAWFILPMCNRMSQPVIAKISDIGLTPALLPHVPCIPPCQPTCLWMYAYTVLFYVVGYVVITSTTIIETVAGGIILYAVYIPHSSLSPAYHAVLVLFFSILPFNVGILSLSLGYCLSAQTHPTSLITAATDACSSSHKSLWPT